MDPMTITFITGANRGLGRETARRLSELGHTVVLGARDAERGAAAAAELGVRFVPIDVTDDASVAAAAADVAAHEGVVDVLVNNAGIGYTATEFNGNSGPQTVTEGTDAIVGLATEGPGHGSGRFVDRDGEIAWS